MSEYSMVLELRTLPHADCKDVLSEGDDDLCSDGRGMTAVRTVCGVVGRDIRGVIGCDNCGVFGRRAGGTLLIRFCSILKGAGDFALVTEVVVNYTMLLS